MGDSHPKKGGRNMSTSAARKMHYSDYRVHKVREKHKIAHVLRSCGLAFAEEYAKVRAMSGYLASLTK